MPCFSSMHCRQDHCKPSHAVNESRYGGPTPPYIPNHKLVAPEPVKSLPVGEKASVGTALQEDPSNLHWDLDWGLGLCPPQDGPAHHQGLSLFHSHRRDKGGRAGGPDKPVGRADWETGEQGRPAPYRSHLSPSFIHFRASREAETPWRVASCREPG